MPLGSEKNSFCYRDANGAIMHDGYEIISNFGETYGSGDTIGMLFFMSPPLPPFYRE